MNRALLVLAGIALAGCNHITTKVPGVLDLRSDGASAPVDNASPTGTRSGFDGILWGDGAQGSGQVSVVDRKYWFLNLVSMGNESATEEINAVMGDGALKGVTLGEQYTLGDCGIGFCASGIPVAGCFVSPGQGPRIVKLNAMRVKGTAIATPAAPLDAPPLDAPPAAPAAPVTDPAIGY